MEEDRFKLYKQVFHTDDNETAAIMVFESLVEHLRTGDITRLLHFFECKQADVENILDTYGDISVLTSAEWDMILLRMKILL